MRATLIIIDGGGTSTDGAAFEGTQEIGRITLPSMKPTVDSTNTDELCRHLGTWLITSRISFSETTLVLVGMSGVWSAEERHSYAIDFDLSWSHYVADVLPRVSIISDAELVQLAALQGGSGIVLLAGTGSIALAVGEDGAQGRCGGWGPRIDDAGSGFWIGREALTAVARMLDGRGADTNLIRPVAAWLEADPADVLALHRKLRTRPVDRCASLAHAVLNYADEGDAVACSIRDRAAHELALLVTTVHGTLANIANNVVFYGSLWNNATLRAMVRDRIMIALPDASCSTLADVCVGASRALRAT